MLDQLQGLHIEPTNMCTLKCPRCSRTEFIEQFPSKWVNKNLDLAALKQFIDVDLTGKIIEICGTYGDAIYYDKLFEMVKYFKQLGSKISISTNGSYRSKEWWNELGTILDSDDQIIFGIDGLPDNFTNYRINADWASIEAGIKVLRKHPVKLVWQFIPFSYNETQINQTRELSQDLGFDEFFVLHSNRWDHGIEELTPSNALNNLSLAKINWKKSSQPTEVSPKCTITNKTHYISADGFYTPCCYIAEHRWYYKSKFYKHKDNYDISKTTLSQILTSSDTIDFYNSINDAKLNYCIFNCPKL